MAGTDPRFTPGDDAAIAQARRAKKLVNLSTIGLVVGLAMVVLGMASIVVSGALAGSLILLGLLVLIAAAIVGQVGRALQGRVI